MVALKQASKEDLSIILKMMESFYQLGNYPFKKEVASSCFLHFISNEHLGRFWLIYKDENLIGYLVLTVGFSFEYLGRDAFIDELYLEEKFRGQGIGSEVMKLLNEKACELEVNAIHLEVEKYNVSGQKLYLKHGFAGNERMLLTKRI